VPQRSQRALRLPTVPLSPLAMLIMLMSESMVKSFHLSSRFCMRAELFLRPFQSLWVPRLLRPPKSTPPPLPSPFSVYTTYSSSTAPMASPISSW
jgi:hypothetical protein